ncbi:hypothetical protein [Hymenobacter cheonanensis]|uniref:hypothetical protein n=1 Tax=Hymenobacter sp. CA2-7 TaxID=3063993 RepID=UPI0027142AA5|nr:hypothetical protein [Hymenobacter sp. CA2-7]MDO7886397.1 hypothetical protein [Hymenobacter sp. CA2-7]
MATTWWLASCSGAHEPTQTASATAHAAVAPTTNVPALLNSSIDGLRSRLGAAYPLPAGYLDPLSVGVASTDSLLAFRTGGLQLVATYNAHTRQVHDLLVLGQQEDSLMGRASLRSSARDYLVLPVFRPDNPNRLLGLRVIATAPQ